MDFEQALANCIRTGNTDGVAALGVGPLTVNEPLLCDTDVPAIPGKVQLPPVRRPRPVIYAILCHQLRVVQQLASLKADLIAPLYNGWHPIHYAVACQEPEITEFILSAVRDERDAATTRRAAPLHLAVSNHDLENVIVLLKGGAAAAFANINGNTPLHIAMIHQDTAIAEVLLSFGADPRAKNVKGQTPEDVAKQRGNNAALEFLRDVASGKRVVTPIDKILADFRLGAPKQDVAKPGGGEEIVAELDLLKQRLSAVEERLSARNDK
jgi:hypothetical protein